MDLLSSGQRLPGEEEAVRGRAGGQGSPAGVCGRGWPCGPREHGPGSPSLKPLPRFLQILRAAAGLLLYFILLPRTRAALTYLHSSRHSEVPTLPPALPSLATALLARQGLADGKEDFFSFIYFFNFLN